MGENTKYLTKLKHGGRMSSEEDKPPAPPVRLTSNRGGSDRLDGPPDLKPLPKGERVDCPD